jgi:hypothetical protein
MKSVAALAECSSPALHFSVSRVRLKRINLSTPAKVVVHAVDFTGTRDAAAGLSLPLPKVGAPTPIGHIGNIERQK